MTTSSGNGEAHIRAIHALLDEAEQYNKTSLVPGTEKPFIYSYLVQALRELLALNQQLATQVTTLQFQLLQSQSNGISDSTLRQCQTDFSFDQFYAAFENKFRGSRELILNRLTIYLPILKNTQLFNTRSLILDLGCGRGEWLELLKDAGYHVLGVDTNTVSLAECRDRNLPVVESDVMIYLRSLPDSSIGMVTGFHIVEHLPFEVLISFLYETLRVLQPGGIAIFETPNPQNLRVGSCNFWTDPTHIKPIYPETLQFLLEYQGFVDVGLVGLPIGLNDPLQPLDLSTATGFPHAVMEQLNALIHETKQAFYSSFDFAAIGQKPK